MSALLGVISDFTDFVFIMKAKTATVVVSESESFADGSVAS